MFNKISDYVSRQYSPARVPTWFERTPGMKCTLHMFITDHPHEGVSSLGLSFESYESTIELDQGI